MMRCRVKHLITMLTCAIACGLNPMSRAVAQITGRTCERVERTADGPEIWMWTEPAEGPAPHLFLGKSEVTEPNATVTPTPVQRESFAGDPKPSGVPVEANLSGQLPASVPTTPESEPPRLQTTDPLGWVGQTDGDALSNPLRFQDSTRRPAEPTAPTAPALTEHSGGDRADNLAVSTSPITFRSMPLWGGDGQARWPPPGPVVPPSWSQGPSHEESIHEGEAESLPQPTASRAAVRFDDRSEEPAGHASSTSGFAPLGFLVSLTFSAVLLPVAVLLILYRLGRRYGLIVHVEFPNPRRPGHDVREQARGVPMPKADVSPSNRFGNLSVYAPSDSTCAEERHGRESSDRDEGRTLAKQILDDNTGLRHQIARTATSGV